MNERIPAAGLIFRPAVLDDVHSIASIAVQRGCGRFEWAVLDWNTPSIEFYERLGAKAMADWTAYRVTGAELKLLAAQAAEG